MVSLERHWHDGGRAHRGDSLEALVRGRDDDSTITQHRHHVSRRRGVSEAMVQETLRWPQCRPHFELPRNLTLFAVAGKPVSSPRGLCAMSAQCGVESHGVPPDRRVTSLGIDLQHVLHRVQSLVVPEANPMCRVAAIVNHAHWEGVCAAFMVKV